MFPPLAVSVSQDRMTGEETLREMEGSNSRYSPKPVFSDTL